MRTVNVSSKLIALTLPITLLIALTVQSIFVDINEAPLEVEVLLIETHQPLPNLALAEKSLAKIETTEKQFAVIDANTANQLGIAASSLKNWDGSQVKLVESVIENTFPGIRGHSLSQLFWQMIQYQRDEQYLINRYKSIESAEQELALLEAREHLQIKIFGEKNAVKLFGEQMNAAKVFTKIRIIDSDSTLTQEQKQEQTQLLLQTLEG